MQVIKQRDLPPNRPDHRAAYDEGEDSDEVISVQYKTGGVTTTKVYQQPQAPGSKARNGLAGAASNRPSSVLSMTSDISISSNTDNVYARNDATTNVMVLQYYEKFMLNVC